MRNFQGSIKNEKEYPIQGRPKENNVKFVAMSRGIYLVFGSLELPRGVSVKTILQNGVKFCFVWNFQGFFFKKACF